MQSHYSIWHQRMQAYAHTLAYARKRSYTLGVKQAYVEYIPNTLTYVGVCCVIRRDQIYFLGMLKIYQRMRAYRIYVTHTLTILTAYTRYASHTLNTLKVRYSYAMNMLLIRL